MSKALNDHRTKLLSAIVDSPGYYERPTKTAHCGRHGISYDKVEGCSGCRQLSVLEIANRVYDRVVGK